MTFTTACLNFISILINKAMTVLSHNVNIYSVIHLVEITWFSDTPPFNSYLCTIVITFNLQKMISNSFIYIIYIPYSIYNLLFLFLI